MQARNNTKEVKNMNQILTTPTDDISNKKRKKTKNRTHGEKLEISSVIKIFCIITIIFGITIIGKSTYAIINSRPKEKDNPSVSMDRMGSKVSVVISTEKPIKQFSYKWNDGDETTIQGDGTVTMTQTISIPNGNNILKVIVIDYYNNRTYYQNQYIRESTDDKEPTIDLSTVGNKIKIVAKDETEISYITYKWNDEAETRIDAEKGKQELDKEVDVKKGTNKLTITAVDSGENITTRTETIIGSNKPTFTISTQDSNLIIEAKDEDGVSKISIEVDGVKNDSDNINLKTLTAKMPLSSGNHTIKVTVTNINGLSDTKEITATI